MRHLLPNLSLIKDDYLADYNSPSYTGMDGEVTSVFMRGSRNFCQGGPGPPAMKRL